MRFTSFCLMFLTFSMAQAQIIFSPGVSYFKMENEDKTSTPAVTTETEVSNYDFKLGYLHSSGLYLGGMYNMSKLNDDDGFATGPTIGFNHYSGFYALFTYHILAEQDASSTVKMTDGKGPQIDLGWVFPLTSMFHLGPQITYKSIKYEKLEGGGVSGTIDYTRTQILPYISLWFKF